jgi:DNA repair photolyase
MNSENETTSDAVPLNMNGDQCGCCASGSVCPTAKMGGKPVVWNDHSKTVLSRKSGFSHKLLCSGPVLNLGDSCVFTCRYCYVGGVMAKCRGTAEALAKAGGLKHHEVAVRRADAIALLRENLKAGYFQGRKDDADFVIFTSSLVDCAGTRELAEETAEAVMIIMQETRWQVRLLSKSHHLAKIPDLIPQEYHHRLIFGFSLGTLDDAEAKVIEQGASLPSVRVKFLHRLQDRGMRTFAMFCPTMPVEDYQTFAKQLAEAARIDRCEHVWAEVFNPEGINTEVMLAALREAGMTANADRINAIVADKATWEQYARDTFSAWAEIVTEPGKLRFLQYESRASREWWEDREAQGAILLTRAGEKEKNEKSIKKAAKNATKALASNDHELTVAKPKSLKECEALIADCAESFLAAGEALYQIQNRDLYKKTHGNFDDYCRQRWGMSKQQAQNLINAWVVVEELKRIPTTNVVDLLPTHESQCRPLKRLKTGPRMRQALDLAVVKAGGKQPTAVQVKEAAATVLPLKVRPTKPALATSDLVDSIEESKVASTDDGEIVGLNADEMIKLPNGERVLVADLVLAWEKYFTGAMLSEREWKEAA